LRSPSSSFSALRHRLSQRPGPLKQTPDGFVALRNGPSPTAPIVSRLGPKDVVLISTEHEPSGEWVYVSRVKGDGTYGPSGWVNGRLIDNDKCS
jgi:hypothetical protein